MLFLKVRPVDMGIDLGSADVGVTQHFLYGDEIRASLQEMRGEAVPKRVRRRLGQNRDTQLPCFRYRDLNSGFHDIPCTRATHLSAALVL